MQYVGSNRGLEPCTAAAVLLLLAYTREVDLQSTEGTEQCTRVVPGRQMSSINT